MAGPQPGSAMVQKVAPRFIVSHLLILPAASLHHFSSNEGEFGILEHSSVVFWEADVVSKVESHFSILITADNFQPFGKKHFCSFH